MSTPRSETDDQRRNRQLVELLNELRLAVPGVQMLFGFLLAVPFSALSSVTTLLGWTAAAIAAGVAALLFAGLWFVLPVVELLRSRQQPERGAV